MTDTAFAQGQIQKYRALQDADRAEVARLDAGARYYEHTLRDGLMDVTEGYRANKLTHIEMFEDLIKIWAQDL